MSMDIRQEFEAWWDEKEYDFMGFETSRGCAWQAYQAGRRAGAEDMRERAAKPGGYVNGYTDALNDCLANGLQWAREQFDSARSDK
jgi:hypothetical protein